MGSAAEDRSPLGKDTTYVEHYQPSLLFPLPRSDKRVELGITSNVPFGGSDIWNTYELSWLTPEGKPHLAVGEFRIPASSPNLVESKSIKLYFNSFSQTVMNSLEEVEAAIRRDLSRAVGADVWVALQPPYPAKLTPLTGECIDDLEVTCDCYEVNPDYLKTDADKQVEETLYSDLFKTNCTVTGMPSWASIQLRYAGPAIDRTSLLQYLVSYRRHSDFHEHCIEKIFLDIEKRCHPDKLSVYARYARRGGLDINPFRSNWEESPPNVRTTRQ